MIVVTRRNGRRFALNPDLIERVEETPDTVVSLVNGTKYVVEESLDSITDAVRTFRATVIVAAEHLAVGHPAEAHAYLGSHGNVVPLQTNLER